MKTATGLALMAIGAILTFAVTASPPFLNLQIVGLILIATGLAGVLIPKRGYGWLRRQMVYRPGSRRPVVTKVVDETNYPQNAIGYPSAPPDAPVEPDESVLGGKVAPGPRPPEDTETMEEFRQD
jgi:hypothetical protein